MLALNESATASRARRRAGEIELIESRIRQLQDMRDALAELVHCCEHTDSPAPCPILRALSSA